MRIRNRSRGFWPYLYWCLAFIALAGGMAWKFGWLPLEMVAPETGTLADKRERETSADGRPQDASSEDPHADPLVFTAQSEPPFEPFDEDLGDRSAGGSGDRYQPSTSLLSQQWDDPPPPVPAELPTPAAPELAHQFDAPIREETDDFFHEGRFASVPQPLNDERRAPHRLEPPRDSRQPPSAEQALMPVGNHLPVMQVGNPAAQSRAAPPMEDVRFEEIDRLLKEENYLAAHKEMSRIYWKQPDSREVLQQQIDTTARSIYFSPQPHYMDPYVVQSGDQLRRIAGRYRVPWEYLAELNRVDPQRIRPGQKLKVIKGPFSALVDLSDRELIIHAHGYYVRKYRIGIGKDGSTPIGKFTVKTKLVDPTYYGPDGEVIDADDPENPLGGWWIDLGDSYGIHGTIEPHTIGKAESRGCIRMLNADVEEVYNLLDIGSEVIIRR